LRLAKQPRMQGLILLLLAGVMLCCLGIFFSLPTLTSEEPGVPFAVVGTNVGHVDRVASAPAPLPDGSYPLTPAEVPQETDKLPVNFYLLTMLVLALAYFVASVGWLLMTNARRRQPACCSVVDDRWWLATVPEGPSFLGVFRL
jgi:ABC-type branched-subunit amino acid transport system permease subunit